MSKKKPEAKHSSALLQDDAMKRFQAKGGLAVIAHEQDCYRVDQHGQVALPANQDWYADLVTTGELRPVLAAEEERSTEDPSE